MAFESRLFFRLVKHPISQQSAVTKYIKRREYVNMIWITLKGAYIKRLDFFCHKFDSGRFSPRGIYFHRITALLQLTHFSVLSSQPIDARSIPDFPLLCNFYSKTAGGIFSGSCCSLLSSIQGTKRDYFLGKKINNLIPFFIRSGWVLNSAGIVAQVNNWFYL